MKNSEVRGAIALLKRDALVFKDVIFFWFSNIGFCS
jgi:hypothetical protein